MKFTSSEPQQSRQLKSSGNWALKIFYSDSKGSKIGEER
jgi:hypothetical protein